MEWYRTIALPSWTPAGSVIGAVWTFIFVLSTIAAIIMWNRVPAPQNLGTLVALFLLNAALNVLWSYLFFSRHLIAASIVEMLVLNLTTLLLIIMLWKVSKVASLLLTPYFLWVSFATYLAWSIWMLNRSAS